MKRVYLIAVVFALLAGFATYLFASNINDKSSIKDAKTVDVIVALQDIPENTQITQDMFADDAGYFETRKVVAADAVPKYISKAEDVVNLVSNVEIYKGEQLSKNRFVSADSDDIGLSFKLSPGMVAYTLSAGSTNGVDGYISAGDTVNLLTYERDANSQESNVQTAYKNLKVIRVSSNSDNTNAKANNTKITTYSTITVECTEKQAQQLYQIESSSNYKIVLNRHKNQEATTASSDTTTNANNNNG